MFFWKPTTKNYTNVKDGNQSNEVGPVLLKVVDSGGHIEYMVMTRNSITLESIFNILIYNQRTTVSHFDIHYIV